MESTNLKHKLKEELTTLDQCSSDQITELKVELRNEMNQLHEANEQVRNDLDPSVLEARWRTVHAACRNMPSRLSYLIKNIGLLFL